jgi:hypothetical protein
MKRIFPSVLFAIAAGVSLSGCAHSPDRLAKWTDIQLCSRYGSMKTNMFGKGETPSIRAEMERRNLFSPDEWKDIDAKKIYVGMNTCALYASWGASYRENKTGGAYGNHVQHVYKCGACSYPNAYVYTTEGKVTSWQTR